MEGSLDMEQKGDGVHAWEAGGDGQEIGRGEEEVDKGQEGRG